MSNRKVGKLAALVMLALASVVGPNGAAFAQQPATTGKIQIDPKILQQIPKSAIVLPEQKDTSVIDKNAVIKDKVILNPDVLLAVLGDRMPGLEAQSAKRAVFGARNARGGANAPANGAFGSTAPAPSSGGIGVSQQGLSVKRETLWDSPVIPVCWESTAANATERGWVRDAVAVTWEAESKVRFTGWNSCPANSNGIRIFVNDEGPHTTALGKKLAGKKNGMVLNFTFGKWSTGCAMTREFCIRAIAVHEFGHALGAGHEQNRNDVPNQACRDQAQGTSPDWNLTPYDLDSVMNYCNPNWNGGGRLSRLDIEGIRSVYGWNKSNSFEAPGVGDLGQGAGAAFANINGNPRPDLIFMANDAPKGPNNIRYRVGFDVDVNGAAGFWSDTIFGPALGDESQGADVAVADINRNGRPDLLMMTYDNPSGPNNFRWVIGWDVDQNGRPARWSPMATTPGLGNEGQGAGADLVDINHDGQLDLVLMAYDNPDKDNTFRYKIGYSVNPGTGIPASWSPMFVVPGVGYEGQGAGVSVRDFDNDGQLEMVLMAYDAPDKENSFRYRRIRLGPNGEPGQELQYRMIPGVGWEGEGAGLAATDIDGDGWTDLLFMAYDAPDGGNNFRYVTFTDPTE